MEDGFDIQRYPVIKGLALDYFLENGWYRYGANIFTIDKIQDEGRAYQVFWLRYHVNSVLLSNSSKKIIKGNRRFDVCIKPFALTEELEHLHTLYFNQIKFAAAATIRELLEDVNNQTYDTQIIEVRDDKQLIAAGIFDLGENSIAGIKNIFNPAYKSFALGKYLMLLKYQYCLSKQISWYYPGYIAPGNPRFDYKLFLDKTATELLDIEKREWVGYYSLNPFQLLV